MTRAIPFALVAALASSGIAAASAPGEYDAGPQTTGVAAPINLVQARETPAGAMTYEIFEATVEHGDLPECPTALAKDGRFCRVVLQNDMLHVFAFAFAFAEDGDQPTLAVMEYPLDAVSFPQ